MKLGRILGILVTLGLVAALAVGAAGSGAWFTDSEDSLSGTVTTGSFDLKVGGGPFSATNLEPGGKYVSVGTFWAKNSGDYDMKFRGWVKNIVDDNNLRSHLLVRCELDSANLPGPAVGSPYGPKKVLWSGVPLLDLTKGNWVADESKCIYLPGDEPGWPFAGGWFVAHELFVRLDSTAKNPQQDATLTLDIYLEATQLINTGWAE